MGFFDFLFSLFVFDSLNRPVSGCFKTFIFIAGAIFAFLFLVVWLLG